MHYPKLFPLVIGFLLIATSDGHTAEIPVTKDNCDDFARFEKNVDQLTVKQKVALAMAYDLGRCVKQDYARAYELYRQTVDEGASLGIVRLGYFYLNGLGVERNEEKARYWFRSEALADIYESDHLMKLLEGDMFFGEPTPEMVRQEVRRAVDDASGPPEIMMHHYRNFLTGNGVHPSLKKAISWLRMAADKGHPEALYDLANRYKSGDGVRKNEDTYISRLRIAAHENSPEAQRDVGLLYLHGKGEKIHGKALENWPYFALVWFFRAQENGLKVDEYVHEAEQLLDPALVKRARKKAMDTAFSQARKRP